ncbi:hypothetical protein [Pyxidicoccus xibeiensis]|uniref:hypothetical protein n=1 Tax=Pyxidicoccus xibeiensis TaxID=2906759 RepID=UPI0020A7FAAC|nr:hypothetical protein [Pyxidicoccus xibeiensis]MCP3141581.1 hypothetical protein [Pyxidicoccus xibeiensis]
MNSRLAWIGLSLGMIACSDDKDAPGTGGGAHYTYVASELAVPTNNSQAREYGLDLNGDGSVDNQLGQMFGTLVVQGFDVQSSVTTGVDRGSTIQLFDFAADNLSNDATASVAMKWGDPATANPAACASGADTQCRRHLQGMGTFTLAPDSPNVAALSGAFSGGIFNGGPGTLPLAITLGAAPLKATLMGARIRARGASESAVETIIVAGAMSEADVQAKLIPAMALSFSAQVSADCHAPGQLDCGCAESSSGKTLIALFDVAPRDCTISSEEVSGSSLIQALLSPDVVIDGTPGLSLGLKAKAVKAMFPTE